MSELWTLENEIYAEGFSLICGVDEAGRGPLAGPVCAAAVILPRGLEIDGLDDSKKLSEKKREKLFDDIVNAAVSYGIAFAGVEEIEEHNILGATFMAMNRAMKAIITVRLRQVFQRTYSSSRYFSRARGPMVRKASWLSSLRSLRESFFSLSCLDLSAAVIVVLPASLLGLAAAALLRV